MPIFKNDKIDLDELLRTAKRLKRQRELEQQRNLLYVMTESPHAARIAAEVARDSEAFRTEKMKAIKKKRLRQMR